MEPSLQDAALSPCTGRSCVGRQLPGTEGAVGRVKRQRDPLSDSEENVPSVSESQEGSKRRCLEPKGNENLDPWLQCGVSPVRSSHRQVEQEVKPDTPAVPSLLSRLKLLPQKQSAGGDVPQPSLTDPVLGQPCCSSRQGEGVARAELRAIGNAEFRSRVERFEQPPLVESPALLTPPSRTLSSLARTVQQRLQSSDTPSASRASRIRQEREEELRVLRSQPISENAWIRRSLSDPALSEQVEQDSQVNISCSRASGEESSSTEPTCQDTSLESSEDLHCETGDANLKREEEMSASGMIDQLFAGVLDTTEEEERAELTEDQSAGVEKEECVGLGTREAADGVDLEHGSLDSSTDELLSLPPSCILSPLSKSVEAVVTPLRLDTKPLARTPSEACSSEPCAIPAALSAPLYSIDSYRTQRQSSHTTFQSCTPAKCRQEAQTASSQPQSSTKDRIKALSDEAAKLQGIISQTLQALSCCTDEAHGRGSLVEAEAERLLLVSCEKRTALLAEVSRLRAGGAEELEGELVLRGAPSQEPCRGTVTISDIQLPLKVQFVCSSTSQTGRPTHYFFVLIRHAPCNIVATPLASAADAQHGDTVSFSTCVTLEDIRPSFEIDVEVYSLSQTSGNIFNTERFSTKSKVTPKKFLSSIKRSSQSVPSAMLTSVGPQRSSNFCLVGSHKVTLASLGLNKFPLDKMKFDGKIRKLLGDEFQEKVPFLSPLEGHVYMKLNCVSHSSVQHSGFLTMFEDVCGFGAWQRRWFSLDGNHLSYWNYPSDERTKPPEGSIKLASHTTQWVRPVKRDFCARPHTFELVSSTQEHNGHAMDKCWFAADTQDERAEWIEKLNQALLDLRTWTSCPVTPNPDSSRLSRESIL